LTVSQKAWLTAAWAYAVAVTAWLIAAGGPAEGRLGHLLRLPVFAAPALAALGAARARSGRDRLGWYQVAAAWLLSTAAGLIWLAATPGGAPGLLDHVAEDWLYNAYYPFMIAGLLLLARFPGGAGARLRLLVDALLVVGATLALAWYFLLRNYAPGQALVYWGAILANLVGEAAVLLCAALVLHRPAPAGAEPGLRFLGLGAFAAAVADLAAAGAQLAPTAAGALTGEVTLVLSAALMATAGLLPPALRLGLGPAAELALRAVAHLPHAAILVVAALLIGELPGVGPAGSPVPVLAVSLVLLAGLAVLRLAIAQRDAEADAYARAMQEERLRQGRKLEVMGELAAAVSHDFANLLVGLSGCASELLDRVPDAKEIRDIQLLVGRGTELCRGLLGFSRRVAPASGADLREVADGVAPLLKRLLPPGLTLSVQGLPGTARALADPSQIEIALVNLVVNARDAMPAGGVIEVLVDAPELREQGRGAQPRLRRWARLAVRDAGCGMDQGTLARCVEPFFTTKPAGRGTGLGLATVNGIVTAAGGRLDIQSAPGSGTRVSLLLPMAVEAGDGPAVTPAPSPSQAFGLAPAPRPLEPA
jgi:signal transduction histidine kinase